jgi:hypothetical protein
MSIRIALSIRLGMKMPRATTHRYILCFFRWATLRLQPIIFTYYSHSLNDLLKPLLKFRSNSCLAAMRRAPCKHVWVQLVFQACMHCRNSKGHFLPNLASHKVSYKEVIGHRKILNVSP